MGEKTDHGFSRKITRIPGFDYSQPGGYFVTICTQGRLCLFGQVNGGDMILSDAGKMIEYWWQEIPRHFPNVDLDLFVTMPTHFHGTILIQEPILTVGEHRRVLPGLQAPMAGEIDETLPLDWHDPLPDRGAHAGAPLHRILQWFKTMTTNAYIHGVKENHWPPFPGKLWQRSYYEHVIRDEVELTRIRNYILDNPLQWSIDQENPDNLMK